MATFLQNADLWRSTLDRLDLEIAPVAMKYCTRQPPGLDPLEHQMAFCEMVKYAQIGHAFFSRFENHTCAAGPLVLGGPSAPDAYETGDFGAALGAYEEPRSMRRRYDAAPMLAKGSIECVAFAPLDRLTFEPDLLVLVSDSTDKTAILLRSLVYKTGDMWESRSTFVLGCAWLYIYPCLSGEWNYITTGMSMGMSRRNLVPAGYQLITVPYDKLPTMLENLQDMPWELPLLTEGEDFMARTCAQLGLEPDPVPFFLRDSR
ncbi:MAG: DUF169 domain-containing protein [Thermoleophilia bacterium]|nr:DUF169 domain-containing protein [Thermoleophilia bacterium]